MKRSVLLVGLFLVVAAHIGQAQTRQREPWTPPRTADGRPDLQGIWTTQTWTPLQRPARFEGQEFLTEEEAAELTRLLTAEGVDPLAGNVLGLADEERETRVSQSDPTHYNNEQWLRTAQPKALSSLRTSLIVDPPDGRIPARTPDADARAAARRDARGYDSYLNRPFQERCIMWSHEGPPLLPPPYNDLYQIFQAPGYVVLAPEMANNSPRIIPTDGRPHIPDQIRQWPGNSIGRWEGDTLVVETRNFNDRTAFQGSGPDLVVVERLTRVVADRIHYEFTVTDPATWTSPWSVELPMLHADGPMFEYTCHEGNYGMVNTLRGARRADREAAVAGSR